MPVFTSQRKTSVRSLGETELIARIRNWLGDVSPPAPFGIGDDCAVLKISKNVPVITVDPVIYGRHFDDRTPPGAVGAKLLKRNLSDLAAMGAVPGSAVVALLLAPTVQIHWLEKFYHGLASAARIYGVKVVGGDVAQMANGFAATLTLLGHASGKRILTRAGAKVGDIIYVTGTLGGSRLGHHLNFTPRLAEGRWLARRAEVRSLMDVSDGLAKDLRALAPKGSRIALDREAIPISVDALREAKRSGHPSLEHALTDGEDYELVFSVDRSCSLANFERGWRRRFGTPLTRIGVVVPKNDVSGLNWETLRGYEHLR